MNNQAIKHPPNGHSVERLAQRAYVIHHERTMGALPIDMHHTPLGWDNLSCAERAAWESVVIDLFQLVSRPARHETLAV